MRFDLSAKALIEPLKAVGNAVGKKSTSPILANALLRLTGERLELTGTDLEIQVTTSVTVDAAGGDGAATVPARKLLDICRALPDAVTVRAELGGERFQVKAGRSRFSLANLPADNYPEFKLDSPDLDIEMPAEILCRAIEKTGFAMAQKDVRYYLNGMCWTFAPGEFLAVSSDGHRLSVHREPAELAGAERQIIVPRRSVLELGKLLTGAETARLQISATTMAVTVGAVRFATKLAEGRFPDYQRVMPRDIDRTVLVERGQLLGALQRVALAANQEFRMVRLDWRKEELVLSANNPDTDEAEESVAIDLDGAPFVAGVNAGYLIDAIQQIGSGQARIGANNRQNVFLIEDAGDSRTQHVVMPVRL
jgi:DNA polymerase-3 subunit beta